MKKSPIAHCSKQHRKLSLRSETVRMLTEHELTLVAAGNCVNGSGDTHISTNLAGVC